MLKVKLGDSEIRTFQPDRDAVVLIAGKDVEMLETTDVSIAGEDINLMDLLIAKADAHKDIVSTIPGRGNKVYSFFSF